MNAQACVCVSLSTWVCESVWPCMEGPPDLDPDPPTTSSGTGPLLVLAPVLGPGLICILAMGALFGRVYACRYVGRCVWISVVYVRV